MRVAGIPLSFYALLGALLAVDTIFIGLHIYFVPYLHPSLDSPPYPRLLITTESGYAELFLHLKELAIVLMLGLLALRRRSSLLLGWAALFLYILLDDALTIHETWGARISRMVLEVPPKTPLMFGLHARDFGELFVTAAFGLLFAAVLISVYWFSHDPLAKRMSRYLLVMVILLAVAGLAIDLGHVASPSIPLWNLLFELGEDGGEMVVMSGIVWLIALFLWATIRRLACE